MATITDTSTDSNEITIFVFATYSFPSGSKVWMCGSKLQSGVDFSGNRTSITKDYLSNYKYVRYVGNNSYYVSNERLA